MSAAETYDRFEELDAGRALGDLSLDEVKEWQKLVKDQQSEKSSDFDWITVELEIENSETCPLPSSLVTRLKSTVPAFTNKEKRDPSPTQIVSIIPWLGWAAAACLLVFFNLPDSDTPVPAPELTAEQKLEALVREAPETQRLAFSPATDPYSEISGEVVWNDERQEGYMSLVNLPVNDPTKNQYQLWIVDPERDELPVDGGVFDIPEGSDTAVIPIRNALQVSKPTLFVITLEQPGGVVKSKQEVVVALAKS